MWKLGNKRHVLLARGHGQEVGRVTKCFLFMHGEDFGAVG